MNQDLDYMMQAFKLAEFGRYSTQPNPRVGCVIVKNNQIIGQGYHQQAGQAHAEINALKQAGDEAQGADVYVSLEPCSHTGKTPPCANALVKAGVKQVNIAVLDPNPNVAGKGIQFLEQHAIEVKIGLGEAHARQLNRGFKKRMETGMPFVSVKLATSLDGKIAMQSGESFWITSKQARADVHRLRLESCAIITGINTILTDNPVLTARVASDELDSEYHLTGRQPVRVVLDTHARLNHQAKICQQSGQTWQFISDQLSQATPSVEIDRCVKLPLRQQQLDLKALLRYLCAQEMNNVMIEAGGTLAASFIKSGLVDEMIVYQSPDVMGASAQDMLNLPDIMQMNQKIQFEYQQVQKIGRDLKLTLTPSA